MSDSLLFIFSPTKTIDFSDSSVERSSSRPRNQDVTTAIMGQLKEFSESRLTSLVGVPPSLSAINYERVKSFSIDPEEAPITKQCIFGYTGPSLKSLNPHSLEPDQLDYLQKHFRIVSGLYGLLRPMDVIQPYRLPMATKLPVAGLGNLTNLWGKYLWHNLQEDFGDVKDKHKVLVSIASNEYSKPIEAFVNDSDIRYIVCAFKTAGRSPAVYSKQGRGLMARYCAINHVSSVEDLKGFDLEGYSFDAKQSSPSKFIFTRSKRPAAEATKTAASKRKRSTRTKGKASTKRAK